MHHYRNLLSFWLFGLYNNFGYVIILSAAVDIIKKEEPFKPFSIGNSSDPRANCTILGTGSILLADIGPGLLLKLFAPLFIQKLHFHLKIGIIIVLQTTSLLIVSLSNSITLSIFGVACNSISGGLGDVSFLGMMAFFHQNVVSTWSSGTGAAGIVASLYYAGLTSFISPQKTMLTTIIVPLLMFLTYTFLLVKPRHKMFQRRHSLDSHCTALQSATPQEIIEDDRIPLFADSEPAEIMLPQSVALTPSTSGEMFRILKFVIPLMLSLTVVYLFEYLINQALFELIYFGKSRLTYEQQYHWFQVLYQLGVFISRSSVQVFRIRHTWILSVLQAINFILFLLQVTCPFLPSIWLMFVLILYEGFLGGLCYVNTFYRVLNESEPRHKELSMTISSFSDALGISLAGFLSIPIHNGLCEFLKS